MGIKNLNHYLRHNCTNSIRCINIADLNGKTLAIDISIYLYKFEGENTLLENIYLMLAIFKHYNIIPLFIFDGKPPAQKDELLKKRKEYKEKAKKQFTNLSDTLENNVINQDDKREILGQMDYLKKQFITVNKESVLKVKDLITAYGASYYTASGEADELCANLVINKKAWACLSEDMDLFVYGCPRVLRYFSLISHTALLYSMKGILKELNMSQLEFKSICVLSGTDYNIISTNSKTKVLDSMFEHFYNYKNSSQKEGNFYNWISTNTSEPVDINVIRNITNMFDITTDSSYLENIKIQNLPFNYMKIKEIMSEEGFIFMV